MKIDTITQAAQQAAPAKTTKAGADFAALLAEHASGPAPAEAPPMTPAVLGVQTALLQQAERTVMEQLTGLMDQWDAYAASVDQANLKRGHAILGAIRERLAAVQDTVAATPNLDARLRTVVEEMEVLGTAEEIKLRRGDYLES